MGVKRWMFEVAHSMILSNGTQSMEAGVKNGDRFSLLKRYKNWRATNLVIFVRAAVVGVALVVDVHCKPNAIFWFSFCKIVKYFVHPSTDLTLHGKAHSIYHRHHSSQYLGSSWLFEKKDHYYFFTCWIINLHYTINVSPISNRRAELFWVFVQCAIWSEFFRSSLISLAHQRNAQIALNNNKFIKPSPSVREVLSL